jgi:hypothetical protein
VRHNAEIEASGNNSKRETKNQERNVLEERKDKRIGKSILAQTKALIKGQ